MSDTESDDRRIEERIGAAYRAPSPRGTGARERLARTLDALPPPRRRPRLWAWTVDPLSAGLRPAAAVAATLAILATGFVLGRWVIPERAAPPIATDREGAAAPGESAAMGSQRSVQFVLVAPGAARVSVVGDFNGWDPDATPMVRQGTVETWTARVELPFGRHVYAFVADGDRWVSDPQAPLAPANEFGFRNSVLIVGESEPL